MDDKPMEFPRTQPNGAPLKPITEALLDRRATSHFTAEEVPDEFVNAILKLGTQAPTGYNLQPWRFIVVRSEENRRRLQQAAFGQAKIGEAPVIIIAIGLREDWSQKADEVFREGAHRGAGKIEAVEAQKQEAIEFLSNIRKDVWLNRHIMVAVTAMMLLAEAYGFDTAPMEGFDPTKVKQEFGIPEEEAEVVALLAIGRARKPDKPYPGRFPLDQVAYQERYGVPWHEPQAV
jgi:nitroreductase